MLSHLFQRAAGRWGALLALACAPMVAQIPDQDSRNADVHSSRTHFKMPVYSNREAWQQRAAFLRKQILASAGLLPMPDKNPLNAQVFGKIDREGYSVEKVLIETYPGFYLGGNLYRPRGKQGPFPAISTPHGHFAYGRLENTTLVSTPARCINLALQGFVVFSYDMIGYNDTNQIPHHWGEPVHELWSIGPMGLQLLDSIRAIDFLTSLPDVDPNRIGVTGASGGGTQTFMVMSVDDRVKAAAPVNMISAISQGGVCENAPNLRVGGNNDTSNMVVGALMAPRRLLLISATGDWTKDTPTEAFPAIQSVFGLMGVRQNVEHLQVDELHNYNKLSRERVYQFFNEVFLGKMGPMPERRYVPENPQDLLVLHGRQRPANAVNHEQLIANWISDNKRKVEQLRPSDAASLAKARADFRERLGFSLLVSEPAAGDVVSEKKGAAGQSEDLLLSRKGIGDRIPALWIAPARANSAVSPTLIVHPDGAAWTKTSAAAANGLVKGILDRGGVVMGIDAFQTGAAKAPREQGNRAFTVFNQTNDANRMQDILTAIAYLKNRTRASTVNLVGLEMGGVWSYFARAVADSNVNLAADLAQFRTDADEEYLQKLFIPGVRKAGDFRAAAVLDTQGKLLLHNAGSGFPSDWVRDSAKAAGVSAEVRPGRASESDLLSWIASAK